MYKNRYNFTVQVRVADLYGKTSSMMNNFSGLHSAVDIISWQNIILKKMVFFLNWPLLHVVWHHRRPFYLLKIH